MSIEVKLYRVLIASPNDVAEERSIVRDKIFIWNSMHSESRRIVLLPIGWETDATPDLKDRGQAVINRQLVDNCDLLIGIFWARIGTPTPEAKSGTAEEIERASAEGKRCIVYFSEKPILPSDDQQQYDQLRLYREELRKKGLTGSYINTQDFGEQVFRHITKAIEEITREERDRKAAEQEAIITERAIELDTQVDQKTNPQRINLTNLTDAKQTIKYLADHNFGTQELEDIKDGEIAEIQSKLNSSELSILLGQPPTIGNIPATIQVIEEISNSSMLAISSIGRFGDDSSIGWLEITGDWIEELSNERLEVGYTWASYIKSYTGLLAFYAIGISALRSGKVGFLKDIFERKIYLRESKEEILLLDVLDPNRIFYDGISKFIEPGFDRHDHPVSDHLSSLMKSKLYPNLTEIKYLGWFDLFEFLVTLKSFQLEKRFPYFGSYCWRTETRHFVGKSIQSAVLKKNKTGMGILELFNDTETLEIALQTYSDLTKNTRFGVDRYAPFRGMSQLIQDLKTKSQ
jgi:hypothetical protein